MTPKKLFLYCLVIATVVCLTLVGIHVTNRNSDECKISGFIESANGGQVILSVNDGRGRYNSIDTAIVNDGHFSFRVFKINQPQSAVIEYFDKSKKRISLMNKNFWAENSRIFISANIKNPASNKISGSVTTDLENKYEDFWIIPRMKRSNSVVQNNNIKEPISTRNDSLLQVVDFRLLLKHHQKIQAIIKQNASSYYALYGISQYYNQLSFKGKDSIQNWIQPLLKDLKFDISKFPIGKILMEDLARLDNIKLGKIAPDFLCYDSSGAEKHFSSLRKKITLIEFWSTGCRPCIEMMPSLTKTYKTYNKKGFEIIGIALNEDYKSYWLAFLKTHPTPWVNMVQSKEMNQKASILYAITFIPQNFLLNERGEIIAENLFGKELDQMLNRLLVEKLTSR